MQHFVTQLIREKMTSVETPVEGGVDLKPPVSIIRSNRMLLKLNRGVAQENVVIRAQNTHITLRIATQLMVEFEQNGLFLSRDSYYDWNALWERVLTPYERKHNPHIWCAIYINGVPIFKTNHAQSAYMDHLEKLALAVDEKRFYDAMLEDMDKGRNQATEQDLALRVDHSTQVALHLETARERLICRLFFRTQGKYHAFSFALTGNPTPFYIIDALRVSAAYMESSNLKIMLEEFERTDAGRTKKEQMDDASAHLQFLEQEIEEFEQIYAGDYQQITF